LLRRDTVAWLGSVAFRSTLRGFSVALIFTLTLAPSAAAADEPSATDNPAPTGELAKAVPDMTGKIWADLLTQLFPDITASDEPNIVATATEMNDVRSIGVADDSWNFCGETTALKDFDAQMVRLGDQRRWIVTVTMADECASLLALFDEAGKLVDAVNVRGDQHVSLEAFRPLGPTGALGIAWNWHDNSDQSYDDPMLVLVKADGFSSIGNLPAFGSRSCRDQFTEEPIITIKPATPMARIDAQIKRRTQKFAADCETKIGRETLVTFDGYWRWNAEKNIYEPHTKELDLLSDWNRKQD
jgi:hypothetical protein